MARVALATVGCKVNQYETQVIRERFEKAGYQPVPFSSRAEVYIINTCTVTENADKKSINLIKQALKRNNQSQVFVTGCLTEVTSEKVKRASNENHVNKAYLQDYFFKFLKEKDVSRIKLVKNVDKLKIDTILSPNNLSNPDFTIHGFSHHDRAFIKVEDGCDQFCSFCRIPYVRGSSINSKSPEKIILEIQSLIKADYREIVLNGVNFALYGRDLNPPTSLVSLLETLLRNLDFAGKVRIRLGSLEPHLISEKLIDLMATSSLFCPHLHLAFQSGDNQVLRRMGRSYRSSQVEVLVENFRKKIPDLGVTGDVIVGFPGEKEDNFYETLRFVEEVGFHRLHIFRFSSRSETPASHMRLQVPEKIKKERAAKLKSLSIKLSQEFISKFIGKNLPVLIESERDSRSGYFTGYTHNYIKVFIPPPFSDQLKGKIVPVKIIQAEPGYTLGKL